MFLLFPGNLLFFLLFPGNLLFFCYFFAIFFAIFLLFPGNLIFFCYFFAIFFAIFLLFLRNPPFFPFFFGYFFCYFVFWEAIPKQIATFVRFLVLSYFCYCQKISCFLANFVLSLKFSICSSFFWYSPLFWILWHSSLRTRDSCHFCTCHTCH